MTPAEPASVDPRIVRRRLALAIALVTNERVRCSLGEGVIPAVLLRVRRPVALLLASLLLVSCATSDRTRRSYLERLAQSQPRPAVPVVVIPGFGVTRLFDPATARFVWGTPRSVVRTRYPDDLDLPWDEGRERYVRDALVPRGFAGSRGPINTGWQLSQALIRYGGYARAASDGAARVYPFEWDWRLSMEDNAQRLDAFLDSIRREQNDPALRVDLVTHSAGGLLALLYLRIGTAALDDEASWERSGAAARAKVRRVVAIASPQAGVTDPLRIAVRPERFIRRTFPAEMVATWPSVGELLPRDGRFVVDEQGELLDLDLHDISAWEQLGIGLFAPEAQVRAGSGDEAWKSLVSRFAKTLARGTLVQRVMARPLPEETSVTLIAGDCVETPFRALRRDDGTFAFYRSQLRPGETDLGDEFLEPGDGTIPIRSATRGHKDRVSLFCSGHQGLAADPSVHRAVVRALLAE
jgi:hypothetical protein